MRKRERDEEFSTFVREATPELLRIAWFLTGDVEDAKELVQASLTKTYAGWSRVRPGLAMPYTRAIMVNHRTDTWRKRRREVLVDPHTHNDPDLTSDPEHAGARPVAEDVAARHDLIDALAALPEQQRRIVVLRYYCDLSEVRVARDLEISVGAVKSAASRGLANLRRHYAHTKETVR